MDETSIMTMNIVHELNASHLNCPLPLLKTKQSLHGLEIGDVLKVLATDPGSKRDIIVYIEHSDHDLLEFKEESGVFTYLIKKG